MASSGLEGRYWRSGWGYVSTYRSYRTKASKRQSADTMTNRELSGAFGNRIAPGLHPHILRAIAPWHRFPSLDGYCMEPTMLASLCFFVAYWGEQRMGLVVK